MSTIQLENVGPIESLSIPVPESGGGIIVLKGRNGRGKTKSLEAIEAAVTGRGSPVVRDGTLRGSIEALGVTITIARKATRKGECEAIGLEGKLSISELIDPGIKSPEAADAKRIKALCALAGAKPDIQLFRGLLKNGNVFDEVISKAAIDSDDVVSMAERVKRDLEAAARKAEDNAAKHEGEAIAHKGGAEGVNLEAPSDAAELEARVEKAVRRQADIEARQRAADEARKARAESEAKLNEALGQFTGPSVADATTTAEAHKSHWEACIAEVEAIEAQLAAAQTKATTARTEYDKAIAALNAARNHERLTAGWKATIAASVPAEPVAAEIEEAAQALDDARLAVETGVLVRKARQCLAKAAEAAEAASAEHVKAKALREAAKGTDEVLSALVGKLGTPLRVEAGRLVLDTENRGATYLAELSPGERGKLAIDIGLDAIGADETDKRAILTLSQEIFEGLDIFNRQAIAEHARARGVLIFTAEASEHATITAEVFEEASPKKRKAGKS